MARLISKRIILSGTVTLETPLSLSGAEDSPVIDHLVARDGAGQPYIPGTSLAGAVRNAADELGLEHLLDNALLGGNDPDDSASLIRFEDAPLTHAYTEVRDSVAIHAVTAAAADKLKFNREMVAAGAHFELTVTASIPLPDPKVDPRLRDQVLEALSGIACALESGQVALGGRTSRGLGQVTLSEAKLIAVDLGSKKGLLDHLLDGKVEVLKISDAPLLKIAEQITLTMTPIGPIMVKSGEAGPDVDQLPLTTKRNGETRMVIPGTSLAGVLRGLAARICASLGKDDPVLVDMLFGAARKNDGNTVFGKAAVEVPDIHADRNVNPDTWFAAGSDKFVNGNLLDQPDAVAAHVAIDRWTGGAADHKLFVSLEPWDVVLEPAMLRLRTGRLQKAAKRIEEAATALPGKTAADIELAARALLFLTLREFCRYNPGIGFGTTRGYGTVEAVFDGLTATKEMQAAWTKYLGEDDD